MTLRHWRKEPLATVALLLLVAVGVASFTAIRLANRAAVQSFRQFTQLVSGSSDFSVTHDAGPFPMRELRELRSALGREPVHLVPVIEATAPLAPSAGGGYTPLTLLGVDLVAFANIDFDQRQTAGTVRVEKLWRETASPAAIAWASAGVIERHGTQLTLLLDGKPIAVEVLGRIPETAEAPPLPENLLLFDLPVLQRVLGREGTVDRVEAVLEPGPERRERLERAKEAVASKGAGRWAVSTEDSRRESAQTMTQAFRLNLTVLSLIALLVGLYLVRQTLEAAVVRRRAELATLRALGLSPRSLLWLWLAEAIALGFLGGSVGVLLGWAGAQFAVQAVGQTVNALYFPTTAATANVTLQEAVAGTLVGVLACVVAGWIPAREASNTPPAQLLAHRLHALARDGLLRRGLAASACLVLAGAASLLPGIRLAGGSTFPLGGYLAAFLAIAGTGLLAGPAVALATRSARGLRPGKAPFRIASSFLARPSRRHGIAAAGIVCAVAMTAGMAVLVASFERSVRGWIEQSLRADFYVTKAFGHADGQRHELSTALLEKFRTTPGVREVGDQVMLQIRLDGLPTQLVGARLERIRESDTLLWRHRPKQAPDGAREAWISESFASRFDASVGRRLTLPSPKGAFEVVVTAVYSDYGNERGSIWIQLDEARERWSIAGATHAALFLADGAQAEQVRESLAASGERLLILDNRTLRSEVLRIFRQTFSITYALEVVGVGVALGGLALTLASLNLERRGELTTLRALGFYRRELSAVARWEGGLMAFTATGLGLLLSLVLGWILVYLVNKQSFGWTLQWEVPYLALLVLWSIVTGAAIAVSHVVGARAAGLAADREEE
ncbi:MAG: FtsX-like permease family protein [Opitutaceae bacterium]|nr:FtsX-like permease family protein [Opitutaceae bacterium]